MLAVPVERPLVTRDMRWAADGRRRPHSKAGCIRKAPDAPRSGSTGQAANRQALGCVVRPRRPALQS
ncbi:hypothetical protein ACFPRL_11990 [Pseudoclavibacter helvolus]